MSKVSNRSIDITKDEDNYSDVEEDETFGKLASTQAHSAWEMGGVHRDHVIQNLLYLGGQLGFYSQVNVPDAELEGVSGAQEKVFYRGIYAPDEVDAIRRLLIDQDDPVDRHLTVYVASIKMVPQFLVPLFYQAVDEKPFAMSLIRLFLLLTKPLSRTVVEASTHIIKRSKGKETAAESKVRVAKEQSARKNSYAQISAQMSFKEALVNEDLFVVLLNYLEEPLSKPSHQRSEEDKIVIESILTLINNLLRISAGPFSPDGEVARAAALHNEMVLVLQGPFLDIILLLCQGVMERDNNPWRVILVEIVHYILGRRESKDLYKVYTSAILAEKRKGRGMLAPQKVAKPLVTGALAERRKMELEARQAVANQRLSNRHSRFTGRYVVPGSLGCTPTAATAAVSEQEKLSDTQVVSPGVAGGLSPAFSQAVGGSMIVSNPFAKVFNRPDNPRRSEKRTAPFNVDDVRSSSSSLTARGGHHALVAEDEKAAIVITRFLVDFLDNAFSELVFSVKEGWRRGVDESDGMTGEEELGYYIMVTTCLAFHRLKQQAEQKQSDLPTKGNRDAAVVQDDRWVPDLRSVTQCFDRMSFIRPVDFMNRLKRVDKKPEKIVFAMELYTELICYLRLMVESIEPAHNDIALAALYKIFYIRQEREDPLPSLLREWAPGTYGRRHLVGLVTLAHEIMKTLDAAKIRFRDEAKLEGLAIEDDEHNAHSSAHKAVPRKKRKSGNPVVDSERSSYLVAACKFEPEEYLKRVLATNQSVKIYTSLLELYQSNTPAVNYYIQIFLQRLCLFKIEDDGFGDISSSPGSPECGGVSLAHMFFNVKSLHAFNTVLQDPKAERNLTALVRLIKQLVLQFGALVEKNKLLFVETLFTPAFPSHHSFLGVVDSVYDAKRVAMSSVGEQEPCEAHHDMQHRSGSDESDFGEEELDESGEYALRPASKPVDPDRGNRKKKKLPGGPRGSKWTWSPEEDSLLKEKYTLYRGTYSVFDMIMNDDEFRTLGGNRSKTAIERRVRALKLHVDASSCDSESEVDSIQASHKLRGEKTMGEHDSEDDRWNGRREFKPKPLSTVQQMDIVPVCSTAVSSLLKKRKKSDSDDDEMDWDNESNQTAVPATRIVKGFTRRTLIKTADESSDEE